MASGTEKIFPAQSPQKELVLSLNEIVKACLWIFCTTKVDVVRHFLVGAAA